jgi:hypothetical protein
MPRCVVAGSYGGHLAITCIDTTTSASRLSTYFADEHRLSMTITRTSGIVECFCSALMRIPALGGVYASRTRIIVGYVAKFDLVLGADWIEATHATVVSQGLARPSPRSLQRLQSGYTWEPFVENLRHSTGRRQGRSEGPFSSRAIDRAT